MTIAPELSYRHTTLDGTHIEPRAAIKGHWAFGQGNAQGLSPGFSSSQSERRDDDFTVQIEGGLVVESRDGLRLDVEGHYSGLGEAETRTVGGKVNLTIPLQ